MYNELQKRREFLIKYIDVLKRKSKSWDKGSLVCVKDGSYVKWYENSGGKRQYLNKSKEKRAEALAEKKYYEYLLEDMSRELKAIEAYMKVYSPEKCKAEKLLDTKSSYRELLVQKFKPGQKDIVEWMNTPFKSNGQHTENLIHQCLSGNLVRSKSEALIDQALFLKKIPYRYECLLQLAGQDYYPDFMILHPRTRKIIYWEHFGMMSDVKYAKNAWKKLDYFMRHGLIPGVNLIITFETEDHPLTSNQVNEIIEMYF